MEVEDQKGQRHRLRQKIVMTFSDNRAKSVLNEAELTAVKEYFVKDISPMLSACPIKKEALFKLLDESQVIDIESDAVPFSHNILENQSNGIIGGENFYHNKEQIHFQQFLAKLASAHSADQVLDISKKPKTTQSKRSSTQGEKASLSLKDEEIVKDAQEDKRALPQKEDKKELTEDEWSLEGVAEERLER